MQVSRAYDSKKYILILMSLSTFKSEDAMLITFYEALTLFLFLSFLVLYAVDLRI